MTVKVKLDVEDCMTWEQAMQDWIDALIAKGGMKLSIDQFLNLTPRLQAYACVKELRRMYPGVTPLRGRGPPGFSETMCLLLDGRIVNESLGLPNPPARAD